MSKNKITLNDKINVDEILVAIQDKYKNEATISTIDGVKLDFDEGWVHLRKSNTEPIIRVYSEGKTEKQAEDFAKMIMDQVNEVVSGK